MTTLIFLPDWATDALGLKGMNVYINPRDNDEYVVYDTLSTVVAPLGATPWNTVEYDKVVYEEITAPVYRHDDPLDIPSVIKPTEPPAPFDLPTTTSPAKRKLKRKRQTVKEEETDSTHPKKAKMTKLSFATHFLSNPEQPSIELLGNIYNVLEGFEINQRTLDVVNAVIQFLYTKSLKNTMESLKRSKRFKTQMRYILNKINGGRY